MRIHILLYDGFDELDAIASYEVLQTAALAGAALTVELAATDANAITAGHGLTLMPQAAFPAEPRPNLLIVPGGGWVGRAARGARAEVERGILAPHIAEYHRAGVAIAAVCTGAMLVAATGLLRGRPAITHHGAVDDLRAAGAEIVQARVVDDGDIVTSGGVTSGLDLALWLVERYANATLACDVERRLEYERRGTVWRRP